MIESEDKIEYQKPGRNQYVKSVLSQKGHSYLIIQKNEVNDY